MKIIETKFNWKGKLKPLIGFEFLVLHHADASKCFVYDIHRWHLSRGWSGIGYHFFVAKDGKVYRGRPENVMGAHVYRYNHRSLGICAEGNYDYEQMPEQQKQAIVELLVYLKKKYLNTEIVGHRNLNPTRCPGTNYPLEEIKKEVEERLRMAKIPEWKKKIIEEAKSKGLITQWHNPDENSQKWFTLAVMLNMLDRVEKRLETIEKEIRKES